MVALLVVIAAMLPGSNRRGVRPMASKYRGKLKWRNKKANKGRKPGWGKRKGFKRVKDQNRHA